MTALLISNKKIQPSHGYVSFNGGYKGKWIKGEGTMDFTHDKNEHMFGRKGFFAICDYGDKRYKVTKLVRTVKIDDNQVKSMFEYMFCDI